MRETISMEIFKRLSMILPKKLVYWAGIRMYSYATKGKYGDTPISKVTIADVITRWASLCHKKPNK